MSNAQLDSFLKDIKSQVISANSETDWHKIFRELKKFSIMQPISYSFTFPWIVVVCLLMVVGGIFWGAAGQPSDQELYVVTGLAVVVGLIVAYVFSKHSNVGEISDLIFYKDLLWDNELRDIEIEPTQKYKELRKRFADFNRGDEQRTIESWLEGQYQGAEHKFKFNLYHFRYIVVTYRTVKVGKSTTVQRVETPYHRYGMLVDFPYAPNFLITNNMEKKSLPHNWETSSKEFNDKYSCSTDSESEIAKFLSPATVLAFCNFKEFNDLEWEVNNGKMCISFSDEIISLERQHGIENPEVFEKEIQGKLHLQEINKLKDFIHKMMTNSDSNF